MDDTHSPSFPIFLRGKRLALCPVSKEDVFWNNLWINDPDTRKYVSVYTPQTKEDTEDWYDHVMKSNTDIVFAIKLLSGTFIGMMGLHHISWKDGHATTGSLIGLYECRGKGYGKEAKHLLLTYAFNELGLYKVCSSVIGFNARSQACLESSGYTICGTRKKHILRGGMRHDEILFEIVKDDFHKKFPPQSEKCDI